MPRLKRQRIARIVDRDILQRAGTGMPFTVNQTRNRLEVAALARVRRQMLDRLRAAASAGASEDDVRLAHTLKGNAAMLGAWALSSGAEAAEQALTAASEQAAAAVQALETEGRKLLQLLQGLES